MRTPKHSRIDQAQRMAWFGAGLVAGLTTLSITLASVPRNAVEQTVLTQSVSEIQARKAHDLNFDSDIAHLSALEDRYRENLPPLSQRSRVKGPLDRISKRSYQKQ